jgi:hypothetical protein
MFAVDRNGNRSSAIRPSSLEETTLNAAPAEPPPADPTSLANIYRDAHVQPLPLGYDILRAAEMADSPRLAGMPPETKRKALLMALDAAGVDLNLVVADAISRQRALNSHEDGLSKELKAFEAEKTEDSARAQAELDRLTVLCQTRVRSNLAEVARKQEEFHAWQLKRQQESQRIVATATLLIPPDSTSGGGSLAALLDRAAAVRK